MTERFVGQDANAGVQRMTTARAGVRDRTCCRAEALLRCVPTMFSAQLNITFTEGWGQGLSRLGGGPNSVGVSLRGHPFDLELSEFEQKGCPRRDTPTELGPRPRLRKEEALGTWS